MSERGQESIGPLTCGAGQISNCHSKLIRGTPQSPSELVPKSLPSITGHAANSRNDSRSFSNKFGFFLFSGTTLCALVSPLLSPGSATLTEIPEEFCSRTWTANLVTPPASLRASFSSILSHFRRAATQRIWATHVPSRLQMNDWASLRCAATDSRG